MWPLRDPQRSSIFLEDQTCSRPLGGPFPSGSQRGISMNFPSGCSKDQGEWVLRGPEIEPLIVKCNGERGEATNESYLNPLQRSDI